MKMVRTDHFPNKSELVTRFLDELLDLAASEALLDYFPIFLLLADLQTVACEALHGLTVALILGYDLDLRQGLVIETDQDFPGVGDHV